MQTFNRLVLFVAVYVKAASSVDGTLPENAKLPVCKDNVDATCLNSMGNSTGWKGGCKENEGYCDTFPGSWRYYKYPEVAECCAGTCMSKTDLAPDAKAVLDKKCVKAADQTTLTPGAPDQTTLTPGAPDQTTLTPGDATPPSSGASSISVLASLSLLMLI